MDEWSNLPICETHFSNPNNQVDFRISRYRQNDEKLDKTKAANRENEKEFVADVDEITPGTEWDRVSKLCDFNAKSNRHSKDMSRMRSIMLQLKQNPPVKNAA